MDESAFAGSIATADRLVRFCVKDVGINVQEAVKMITVNPAKVMGLKGKGKIKVGYDADIVIFDEDIHIEKVLVGGQVV
jgi:N-acetylglucosamine-6-phosphate deacetylase